MRCRNALSPSGTSGQKSGSVSWSRITPAASLSTSAIQNSPSATSAATRSIPSSSPRHKGMPRLSSHDAASFKTDETVAVSTAVARRMRTDGSVLKAVERARPHATGPHHVRLIAVAELGDERTLFSRNDDQLNEDEADDDEREQQPVGQHQSQRKKQRHARRVERVTNPAIRADGHERVVLLGEHRLAH